MTDEEIDTNALAVLSLYKSVFDIESKLLASILNRVYSNDNGALKLEVKVSEQRHWKPYPRSVTVVAKFNHGHSSAGHRFVVSALPFGEEQHTIFVTRKVLRKFDELLTLFSI